MNPPKMPIHIGDLLRDTGHLRALLMGAYMLLLFHHWSTGALPNDDEQLSAIARLSPAEWRKARPILIKFFDEEWHHGRVEYELEKARNISEAAREAGKASGRSRSVKPPLNGRSSSVEPTLEPLNHSVEDRIGDAGASGFTEGSKALASAFWKALGFESPLAVPPEYAGTDWRAIEWERAGWTVDLIESVTRKTGNKPLSYHEKCFATEFAKRQAPLPIVEIKQAEKLTVTGGRNGKTGDIIAASDKLVSIIDSFGPRPREDHQLRGPEGEADVRLLSQG